MALIWLGAAWLLGIFVGALLDIPLWLCLTGLLPLLLLFVKNHRRVMILACLSLFLFFTAGAYAHSRTGPVSAGDLRLYNDKVTSITGVITEDPDVRDRVTHLRLEVRQIKLDGEWRPVSGRALLFVSRLPAYQYGDELLVTGKLETPPQLGDFDYRGYLEQQGIFTTVSFPKMEVVSRGNGSAFMAGLYSVRHRLAGVLASTLPEPQAALAQGMVLGIRAGIPPSVMSDFSRSGTMHILAISGLNLSILCGILLSLGIRLFGRRRFYYIWFALGIIWLYSLLTGLSPSILRSAIMASVFLAAEMAGRQRRAFPALVLAAAIMAGLDPNVLRDVSFQLSFLAMAGLVFILPVLRRWVNPIKTRLGEDGLVASAGGFVFDSLGSTVAATLAVWPLVAYYFGIVALISPLATCLVLPVLPAVIITGILAGGIGLLFIPLAQAIGWLAWLFLSYVLVAVNLFPGSP